MLALLTADFCVWFIGFARFVRVRKLAVGVCAAVLLYSAMYGVAFAGIYTTGGQPHPGGALD